MRSCAQSIQAVNCYVVAFVFDSCVVVGIVVGFVIVLLLLLSVMCGFVLLFVVCLGLWFTL